MLNWMEIAIHASSHSNCKKTKTGAVIVDKNAKWCFGHNWINDTNECENCPRKHSAQGIWGEYAPKCSVQHAEVNVIEVAIGYGIELNGSTMYCTYKPCIPCATEIINAGISKVVYFMDYEAETGIEKYMELNGVTLVSHEVDKCQAY